MKVARLLFILILVVVGLAAGMILQAATYNPQALALEETLPPDIFICPNGGGGLCTYCSGGELCRVPESIQTPTSPVPVISSAQRHPPHPLPSPTRRPPLAKALTQGFVKLVYALSGGK